MDDIDRSAKRIKLDASLSEDVLAAPDNQSSIRKGLDKPISPPLSRRKGLTGTDHILAPTWSFDDVPRKLHITKPLSPNAQTDKAKTDSPKTESTSYISSPFQLTHIQDLAPHENVDAVQLKDILGDPMIKECWNFNFLFDLDFVM
jgi:tyrosyl-DNA phosphodiesterase-1